MNLEKTLEQVSDKQSFLTFIKALIKDRREEIAKERNNPSSQYGPGANGWENKTIETFLEACVACMEDDKSENTSDKNLENLWKTFATFLYSGKSYE